MAAGAMSCPACGALPVRTPGPPGPWHVFRRLVVGLAAGVVGGGAAFVAPLLVVEFIMGGLACNYDIGAGCDATFAALGLAPVVGLAAFALFFYLGYRITR